jgi:gamma-glutamylcyclotransferase (GGCT)/AIG2-like uncharacterized protein YtfP
MHFAVNGTLMRGLELNQNMLAAGATFVTEAKTAPLYRLWSIANRYPGMIRDNTAGAAIALEIWEVDGPGLIQILNQEPPGLTIGRIVLEDGSEVLGVLAEPYLTQGQTEITCSGGWRNYLLK